MKRYFSTEEMARRLNLSSVTVRQYARNGRICPFDKVGGVYVFYPNSMLMRAFQRPRRRFEKAKQKLAQQMM